jgi:Protein of unknown function (DUF2806)
MALLPDKLPGERLLSKIWKTVADNGVGGLVSPWQIKRVGKARAEARRATILMLAQTQRDAADIAAGRKSLDEKGKVIDATPSLPSEAGQEAAPTALPTETVPLLEHLREIGTRREIDRAVNTAAIISMAEEEAESLGDVPVSDIPVDPDWFARWRVNAEDVRDEQMQRLWARILAGEVKEPGSYSLHTIDFIRRLSKDDAALIEKLARFITGRTLIKSEALNQLLDSKGLSFQSLLELQDLGVLSGVEAIGLQQRLSSERRDSFFNAVRFRDKALVVSGDDSQKVLALQMYSVTKVGQQVVSLGKFAADIDYVLQVAKEITGQGFKVAIGDAEDDPEVTNQYTVKNAKYVE